MQEPILAVSDLRVKFDDQLILDNVNFEVEDGETVAIIGPNGAGKTVLFRSLLGLIPFEGKVIWRPGTRVGYVPQKLAVEKDLPLTVNDFLSIKENNPKEIKDSLLSVGFKDEKVLKQKLGILSGGEFQRILIAWALLGDPQILLFDEPTSGVDVSSEETIYSFLKRFQERKKIALILISHELEVVYRYAKKVVCLNKKQVCFGLPREVLDKESLEKIFGGEIGYYQHH